MKRSTRIQLGIALAIALISLPTFAAQIGGGPCVVNSNPLRITPPDCQYNSPSDLVHGPDFDPNTSWNSAIHGGFTNVAVEPGGIFGGTVDTFGSDVTITVTGRNELEGFTRTVKIPADCEAHAGPYDPEAKFISFETEMMRIEGVLENDPDFEYVRIVGGTANGYPSPGHVTATDQGNGTHVVDSMFDISFSLEYVGAPGSPLEGHAGQMEGTATMKAYGPER